MVRRSGRLFRGDEKPDTCRYSDDSPWKIDSTNTQRVVLLIFNRLRSINLSMVARMEVGGSERAAVGVQQPVMDC